MTGTTTVRVQDGTIHIGTNARPQAGHAVDVSKEHIVRSADISLLERLVLGSTLFVLVLEVCDVLARMLSMSGLPRHAAWYQVMLLILATLVLVATGSRFLRAIRKAAQTRVVTLHAGMGAVIFALYGCAYIAIIFKLPGAPAFFEITTILVGLGLILTLDLVPFPSRIHPRARSPVASPAHTPVAQAPRQEIQSQIAHVHADIASMRSMTTPVSAPAAAPESAGTEVLVLDPRVSEGEVLWLAACLEAHSDQAHARKILETAHERGIVLKHVDHFSRHGETLYGQVEGRKVSIRIPDHDDRYPEVKARQAQEKTVIMVDQNGTTVGAVAIDR